MTRILFILLSLIIFSGCNTQRFSSTKTADHLAEQHGFSKKLVKGGDFWFTTYERISNPNAPVNIYIEGDGKVIANRYAISDNPTPSKPVFINLAFSDPRPNVVYLARPCQYTPMDLNSKCNNTYWTNLRFSEDSIEAMNQAVNKIAENRKINLIGYSGGGGVAVLITARNKNVNSILTIAANLNIKDFTEYHKSPAMVGSLNPAEYADSVKNVPQIHFSGGMDKTVPPFIGERFVSKIQTGCARHEIIPEATHNQYWKKYWNYILNSNIVCRK